MSAAISAFRIMPGMRNTWHEQELDIEAQMAAVAIFNIA
jgi:hypothetical protein